MSHAISSLSIVPVRRAANHKSEMTSQILFGEMVEVLEEKGKSWFKVRCCWDNHIGWVAAHQLTPITPGEYERFEKYFAYNLDLMQGVMADDHALPITIGAQLPEFDGLRFSIGTTDYTFSGQAVFPDHIEQSADFILKMARRYLGSPYLWGGRSPFGIDSAGLVQLVFKMMSIHLPREAGQQVYLGKEVDFMAQSRAGDLAFFENNRGRINHVGIIMEAGEIIHVHDRVRIDAIDHFGIYRRDRARYTHRLRVVRRIIPLLSQTFDSSLEKAAAHTRQVELFKPE